MAMAARATREIPKMAPPMPRFAVARRLVSMAGYIGTREIIPAKILARGEVRILAPLLPSLVFMELPRCIPDKVYLKKGISSIRYTFVTV
jgi:hypothetical protein